jgi:hypothetical protein
LLPAMIRVFRIHHFDGRHDGPHEDRPRNA